MPKPLPDARSRRFLDEFQWVRVSRFRADGTIDPKKQVAVIPFPNGKSKLIGVKHTWFPQGGGWSYFVCPGCARRTTKLWLLDDAARCMHCCYAMNIKHRVKYGLTRADRQWARELALDALKAKLTTQVPLRLKPAPKSWRGRAQFVYKSQDLANTMSRAMVAHRLNQLVGEYSNQRYPLPGVRQLVPEVIQHLTPHSAGEAVEQALDKAQDIILKALDHEDAKVRLNAAKLMLNTKQGRELGFGNVTR